MTRAKRLRQLIAKDCVAMPGVPNASVARQVERAGFDAVYISGAGLAHCTAGLPASWLLALTEVALLAGVIAEAAEIPASVAGPAGTGRAAAGTGLRRSRRRRDFSGSVANETRVSRFRQGNGGSAAGEYDRIRQIALAPIR